MHGELASAVAPLWTPSNLHTEGQDFKVGQRAALDRPDQARVLQDEILAPHGPVGPHAAVQRHNALGDDVEHLPQARGPDTCKRDRKKKERKKRRISWFGLSRFWRGIRPTQRKNEGCRLLRIEQPVLLKLNEGASPPNLPRGLDGTSFPVKTKLKSRKNPPFACISPGWPKQDENPGISSRQVAHYRTAPLERMHRS